jgi:hypothetical protein
METSLTARKGELLLRSNAQGMLPSADERIESSATGSVRVITPNLALQSFLFHGHCAHYYLWAPLFFVD